MSVQDLGTKTKTGILYNIAAKVAGTGGQVVSTIILARLLTPVDFGIVAAGFLVIGFATKFGEFGFHNGLIQRKEEISNKHINTLFILDFSFKLALWLLVYFFADPIAQGISKDPEMLAYLPHILPVLASFMLLECFSTTPYTVLKRNMDFKTTSIIKTVDKFVAIFSSIAFAFAGFGVWSLIYSKLLSVAVAGILVMAKTKWVPKLQYDQQASRELFRFGIMIFLRNLLRYGADKIDFFLVTRFLGAQAIGFYDKAFEFMRLPQKRITRAINKVIFSAFSRIQDEPERIRRAFKKLILAVSLISFPILAIMGLVAPMFVTLLLGDQWEPVAQPLQILCIAGILRSIDPFLNSLLTATGYVRSTVTRRAFELVFLAVATWFGLQHGIIGVAVARVVAAIFVMILMVNIITKVTNVKWMDFLGAQLPAMLYSLLMIAAMYFTGVLCTTIWVVPEWVMVLLQPTVGVVTYIALIFLIRFKNVDALLDEIRSDTKKIRLKLRKKIPLMGRPK